MWDGFDKRKFPRINVRCEVVIQIAGSSPQNPISSITENLGVGGICVILRDRFERFNTCHVRIELDKKLPWIECQGKVIWVVPTHETKTRSSQFDTGIEFVNLDAASSVLIRQYIDSKVSQQTSK